MKYVNYHIFNYIFKYNSKILMTIMLHLLYFFYFFSLKEKLILTNKIAYL